MKVSNTAFTTIIFREHLENTYNDPSVNTNVYLCEYKKEIDGDYFGVGTTGGACSPYLNWHGVIMGYDYSDIIVARVNFLNKINIFRFIYP